MSVSSEGVLSHVARRARAAYRATGLLVLGAAAMTLVALWIHHRSELLPRAYTVFEPIRTLKGVLELPGFMLTVLATFLLGRLRRRGEWQLDRIAAAFKTTVSLNEAFPNLGRRALLTALVLLVDGLWLEGQSIWDFLALAVVAFVSSKRSRSLGEWLRLGAHTLLAALVFMAICYSYTVLKALTFVGRAEVDAQIIALEQGIFGVVPHRVVAAWVSRHPDLLFVCDWVYFRFFHHMALTTVLLVSLRLGRERIEYLGALAICYIVGGPLYHVWPGAGPGYFDSRAFTFLSQHPLLANPIRAWLYENTSTVLAGKATLLKTWGYIACMPSLHVAQEFVMLYYARHSRVGFALSFVFTAITLLAVVALGWHYPLDSIAGGLVAVIAIKVAHWQRDHLMPASVSDERDFELPPRRPVLRELLERYRSAKAPRNESVA
ncbi:MAG: phosphatase PAP2 family protein [Myxococcota bacterium]